MSTSPLRLLVAALILVMLARAGRVAWHQRALAREIWRRVRWHHVAGALVLLVVVATVAIVLIEYVPLLRMGLGDLVGFNGNAVFVPLEEAANAAGPPPTTGPDWVLIGLTTAFLGPLLLLLPWLAFAEEELFRAGVERASPVGQAGWALRFGLAHVIMLVPVGATLAIAVAGYVYGRVYIAGYQRWDGSPMPEAVRLAFRPTRRSAAAADAVRRPVDTTGGWSEELPDLSPEYRQANGVLASTVWHTTFNTMVVVVVWLSIVAAAW